MKALVSFSSQKVAALTKDFLGVTKILGALFYTDLNFYGIGPGRDFNSFNNCL